MVSVRKEPVKFSRLGLDTNNLYIRVGKNYSAIQRNNSLIINPIDDLSHYGGMSVAITSVSLVGFAGIHIEFVEMTRSTPFSLNSSD